MSTLLMLANDRGIPQTVDGKIIYLVRDDHERFEFTTDLDRATAVAPERVATYAESLMRLLNVVWVNLGDDGKMIPEEVMDIDD